MNEAEKYRYNEGLIAASSGKELWENPHVQGSSSQAAFNAWFSGWCAGMQLKAKQS